MRKFHTLKVLELRQEAEEALRVVLEVPPELEAQFRAQAGQHVVVRVRLGDEELRRTYSVTGAAGELPLTLGIRVHARGRCSAHVARTVKVGDVLDVMPPGGNFGAALAQAVAAPRATYVAFAAGSGITPVLSVVRTALAQQPAARVILFFGNRSAARTMFFEELQALKNVHMGRLALHFLMSDEPQEAELLNGRLDGPKVRELAGRLFMPSAVDACFICGPGTMIEDVARALQELGVAATHIHGEHFTTEGAFVATAAAVRAHTALPPGGEPAAGSAPAAAMTEVTVLVDGRRRIFSMRTDEETILDAAERAGLELPYACRAGVCSTCRTKLLRGEVTMGENYSLEDWEIAQGYILACQSRARTREIELDYDAR